MSSRLQAGRKTAHREEKQAIKNKMTNILRNINESAKIERINLFSKLFYLINKKPYTCTMDGKNTVINSGHQWSPFESAVFQIAATVAPLIHLTKTQLTQFPQSDELLTINSSLRTTRRALMNAQFWAGGSSLFASQIMRTVKFAPSQHERFMKLIKGDKRKERQAKERFHRTQKSLADMATGIIFSIWVMRALKTEISPGQTFCSNSSTEEILANNIQGLIDEEKGPNFSEQSILEMLIEDRNCFTGYENIAFNWRHKFHTRSPILFQGKEEGRKECSRATSYTPPTPRPTEEDATPDFDAEADAKDFPSFLCAVDAHNAEDLDSDSAALIRAPTNFS